MEMEELIYKCIECGKQLEPTEEEMCHDCDCQLENDLMGGDDG